MPSVLAIISKAVFEKLAKTVALGDVIEQREAFVGKREFNDTTNDDVKSGRRVEVPVAQSGWVFADLIRTDKMAKAVVDEIASWDSGPKPKQRVLEVIAALGPLCVPHLEKAIAKKPPQKALLAAGLKLAAKS